MVCPECGAESANGARFCHSCGAALAAAIPAGEERKVVSVLFVDLVGFTGRSDRADPEDVRATLRPYHERLKEEIEAFGGTVEKFIGDAVMAVFGAPVAHEDDAERAVRAALRVLDAIGDLNEERPGLDLAVRAAVTTGEAVVALGARPERGEGIATGDVVNVASRLQSAAPVGAVLVDEPTVRSTSDAIDYEAFDPVVAKGKSEPIAAWRATGARSRFGVDTELRARTPFVGRDRDLAVLLDTFVDEPSVQLVTIVGEPGLGKSRLVWELSRAIDRKPELVRWRQGRCLPWGEGITFWALGEIVKAEAGVLESDSLGIVGALEETTRSLPIFSRSQCLAWPARIAVASGRLDLADAFLEGAEPATAWDRCFRPATRAALAEARGNAGDAAALYREAAERFGEWGSVVEQGYALLGLGRCGDAAALREGQAIFAGMDASPVLARAA